MSGQIGGTVKNIVISINSFLYNRGSEALICGLIKTIRQSCNFNTDITIISTEDNIADKRKIEGADRYLCRYSYDFHKYHPRVERILKRINLYKQDKNACFFHLTNYVKQADVFIVIGADNYCGYGAFDEMHRFNVWVKSILNGQFWFYDCSIEEKYITRQIVDDLSMFDGITVRDSLSMKAISGNGIYIPTYLVPDPAFLMEKEHTEKVNSEMLLESKDYVVVNVSDLILDEKWGGKKDRIIANYCNTIKFIRKELQLKVLLLPHVMAGADLKALSALKNFFFDDNEVILFDNENVSATQLKNIISNSKFVITARTHVSIAAYSELVPTLVLGYSIKSIGIAVDLFDEYEPYVVPNESLVNVTTLTEKFQWIVDHEDLIIKRLQKVMPQYKKKAAKIGALLFGEELKGGDKCCGCAACSDVCPQSCITMKYKKEGFYYPVVDASMCVDCKLCSKVCPMCNELANDMPQVYAAFSKDEFLLKKSSSGGLFSELSTAFLNKYNGIVWGASLDEDFCVKHIHITSSEELSVLRGSKYQQSSTEGIYKTIEETIKNRKYVLFSGTPCQIAALYSYLQTKNLDNSKYLYTIEVVCHGVPSREVFIKYLTYLEGCYSTRPVSINWRSKTEGWGPNHITIKYEDGSITDTTSLNNPYQKGFLDNVYLRPSCYNCSFARLPRVADISLADFWGYDGKLIECNNNRGISLAAVSTKKGQELFGAIINSLVIEEVTVEYAKSKSRHFWIHPLENNDHIYIYNNIDTLDFSTINRLYINPIKQSEPQHSIIYRAYRKTRRVVGKIIRMNR